MNKIEILLLILRSLSGMGAVVYIFTYIGKLINKESMSTGFLIITAFWIILTLTLYKVI